MSGDIVDVKTYFYEMFVLTEKHYRGDPKSCPVAFKSENFRYS